MPDQLYSGMALGVDQWAFRIAHKLKIPVIAAIPFVGQEKLWPQKAQNEYYSLLNLASETIVVSKGGFSAWKMQARNEYMVNQLVNPDDVLIAVWNGLSSGTGKCVEYAVKKNKKIIRIDPNKLQTSSNTI
jgi:uncharacterized phage-like protein YoqJ